MEIYNPLNCEIPLDGWELIIISNCNSTAVTDLTGFNIGAGQALRFSGSSATLYQDGVIQGFTYSGSSGNLNFEWNGQQRDGARLVDPSGTTVDLALPANFIGCANTTGFYQNNRLVRQSTVCQGSATFNFAEWTLIPVAGIGALPVLPTHTVTCTAPAIGTSGLWTGIKNNDWHDCANWSDFRVPDATTSVVINETASNYCEISAADAVCNSLSIIGSGAGDISLQIINGNELEVMVNALVFRNAGNGFSAIYLNNGTLDIVGDLQFVLNSPVTTSSVFVDLAQNTSNLLRCNNVISQNVSPVFNQIDFNIGFNGGTIECENFTLIGNGTKRFERFHR